MYIFDKKRTIKNIWQPLYCQRAPSDEKRDATSSRSRNGHSQWLGLTPVYDFSSTYVHTIILFHSSFPSYVFSLWCRAVITYVTTAVFLYHPTHHLQAYATHSATAPWLNNFDWKSLLVIYTQIESRSSESHACERVCPSVFIKLQVLGASWHEMTRMWAFRRPLERS